MFKEKEKKKGRAADATQMAESLACTKLQNHLC